MKKDLTREEIYNACCEYKKLYENKEWSLVDEFVKDWNNMLIFIDNHLKWDKLAEKYISRKNKK